MAGATILSDLGGLLKRYYGGQFITAQQQFDPDYISTMPRSSDKPGGDSGAVYLGINMQRRQNGGAQNENENFRANESGTKVQSTITSKVNIWAVEMSNKAIELSKGNPYAFVNGLEHEFSDALAAFKKDENRQCFGDGTGVLALVNGAVVGSTSVIVDTPGVQYFFPGMRIDIHTSASVAEALNVAISSIDESTLTLTLATAVTVSNNSYIRRAGVLANAPTDGKEMMGLSGIADNNTLFTTFQGLSRATYTQWQGTVVDAASAQLTSDLLQKLVDKVERRSGKTVDTLVSHRNQRRQYLNLVTPQKRFQDDSLDSGFQVLEWNGMKWAVSHDCQKDVIYAYPKKAVEVYESYALKLDDSNGNTLTRIPGTDTVEAYYKHYANIGTKHPASVGKLTSLATLTE